MLKLGLKKEEHNRKKLAERLKGTTQGGTEASSNHTFEQDNVGVEGNPLFVIPKISGFRRFTCKLLRSKYYDWFIITVICINSV